MTANVMVVVERQFDFPRQEVFQAWTDPQQLKRWRGSPGWHVEDETVGGDLKLGGRHTHVKIRDNDPTTRVVTDGVYSEYFEPDVFVSRERITGDPGIDPNVPLELRVEFTKYGREGKGTLVRIIQGPYDPDVAGWHGEGWEKELTRLQNFLAGTGEYANGGRA
ncbi:SRPBCC family protein [Nostocoides australiense]